MDSSPKSPLITKQQRKLFEFFAEPYMCDWDGCNELHESYVKEKKAIAGTCTSCQMSRIRAKYSKLILDKIK